MPAMNRRGGTRGIGTRGFTRTWSLGPERGNTLEGVGLRHVSNLVRHACRESAYRDLKHALHYGIDSVARKYAHPEWDGVIQYRWDDGRQEAALNLNGVVVRVSFRISSESWDEVSARVAGTPREG